MSEGHPETAAPRLVGGLWCGEVLERLPDYLDGQLSEVALAGVNAHLAGCDWCERFGGAYAGVVGALRAQSAEALEQERAERLDRALWDALELPKGGG